MEQKLWRLTKREFYVRFAVLFIIIRVKRYIREKVNVVSVCAMKAYRGSRGIDPLILEFGTVWR